MYAGMAGWLCLFRANWGHEGLSTIQKEPVGLDMIGTERVEGRRGLGGGIERLSSSHSRHSRQ
jgi:hypothetical protein